MSFWLRRKDKKGRLHYVLTSAPVLLLPLLGLLAALLLHLLLLIRACVVAIS